MGTALFRCKRVAQPPLEVRHGVLRPLEQWGLALKDDEHVVAVDRWGMWVHDRGKNKLCLHAFSGDGGFEQKNAFALENVKSALAAVGVEGSMILCVKSTPPGMVDQISIYPHKSPQVNHHLPLEGHERFTNAFELKAKYDLPAQALVILYDENKKQYALRQMFAQSSDNQGPKSIHSWPLPLECKKFVDIRAKDRKHAELVFENPHGQKIVIDVRVRRSGRVLVHKTRLFNPDKIPKDFDLEGNIPLPQSGGRLRLESSGSHPSLLPEAVFEFEKSDKAINQKWRHSYKRFLDQHAVSSLTLVGSEKHICLLLRSASGTYVVLTPRAFEQALLALNDQSEALKELAALRQLAKRHVHELPVRGRHDHGRHLSWRSTTLGDEFSELLETNEVVDPRQISWAATARRGHPVIRRFFDRQQRTVILVLSPKFRGPGAAKSLGAILWHALLTGDRVCVFYGQRFYTPAGGPMPSWMPELYISVRNSSLLGQQPGLEQMLDARLLHHVVRPGQRLWIVEAAASLEYSRQEIQQAVAFARRHKTEYDCVVATEGAYPQWMDTRSLLRPEAGLSWRMHVQKLFGHEPFTLESLESWLTHLRSQRHTHSLAKDDVTAWLRVCQGLPSNPIHAQSLPLPSRLHGIPPSPDLWVTPSMHFEFLTALFDHRIAEHPVFLRYRSLPTPAQNALFSEAIERTRKQLMENKESNPKKPEQRKFTLPIYRFLLSKELRDVSAIKPIAEAPVDLVRNLNRSLLYDFDKVEANITALEKLASVLDPQRIRAGWEEYQAQNLEPIHPYLKTLAALIESDAAWTSGGAYYNPLAAMALELRFYHNLFRAMLDDRYLFRPWQALKNFKMLGHLPEWIYQGVLKKHLYLVPLRVRQDPAQAMRLLDIWYDYARFMAKLLLITAALLAGLAWLFFLIDFLRTATQQDENADSGSLMNRMEHSFGSAALFWGADDIDAMKQPLAALDPPLEYPNNYFASGTLSQLDLSHGKWEHVDMGEGVPGNTEVQVTPPIPGHLSPLNGQAEPRENSISGFNVYEPANAEWQGYLNLTASQIRDTWQAHDLEYWDFLTALPEQRALRPAYEAEIDGFLKDHPDPALGEASEFMDTLVLTHYRFGPYEPDDKLEYMWLRLRGSHGWLPENRNLLVEFADQAEQGMCEDWGNVINYGLRRMGFPAAVMVGYTTANSGTAISGTGHFISYVPVWTEDNYIYNVPVDHPFTQPSEFPWWQRIHWWTVLGYSIAAITLLLLLRRAQKIEFARLRGFFYKLWLWPQMRRFLRKSTDSNTPIVKPVETSAPQKLSAETLQQSWQKLAPDAQATVERIFRAIWEVRFTGYEGAQQYDRFVTRFIQDPQQFAKRRGVTELKEMTVYQNLIVFDPPRFSPMLEETFNLVLEQNRALIRSDSGLQDHLHLLLKIGGFPEAWIARFEAFK